MQRKLFNELFLYSDDLPTLVSGRDNLANIVYLNHLTTGRPFFWEVLVFRSIALYDMLSYLRNALGKEMAERFRKLVENDLVDEDIEGMFVRPREYRRFF